LSIEVEGIDDLKAEVKAYLDTLKDIKTLYTLIEQELEQVAQQSIQSQQSATTGRSYAPLTPTTQELQNKPPRPALWSRTLGGSPMVKMTLLGKDSAMISSQIPYSEVHQYGNPNNTLFGRKAPIPARPFLPVKRDGTFSSKFEERLEEITSEWIDEKLEENR
jgi:phage virion morphogenesis protein